MGDMSIGVTVRNLASRFGTAETTKRAGPVSRDPLNVCFNAFRLLLESRRE